MNLFKDRRVKLLLVLTLAAGFLVGLKLLLTKQSPPQIIETQPKNDEKAVEIDKKIVVVFDQKIKRDDWEVAAFPSFSFDLKAVDNRLEVLPSSPLGYDREYRLEVKSPTFSSFYHTFSFATVPVSPGIGNPYFLEEAEESMQKNYPLLNNTPYEAQNFSVDYIGPLKLLVKLGKDTPQIRQEVLDWIKSKGVDPASHQIVWKLR